MQTESADWPWPWSESFLLRQQLLDLVDLEHCYVRVVDFRSWLWRCCPLDAGLVILAAAGLIVPVPVGVLGTGNVCGRVGGRGAGAERDRERAGDGAV